MRPDLTLIEMTSVSPGRALRPHEFFFVERPEGGRMSCEYKRLALNAETAEAVSEGISCNRQGLIASFIADHDQTIRRNESRRIRHEHISRCSHSVQAHTIPEHPRGVDVEAPACRIWKTVLKIPMPSRTDNFFALGGHSTSGIRFCRASRRSSNKRHSCEDLYTYPTIRGAAGEPIVERAGVRIRREGRSAVVLCSPARQTGHDLAIHDTFIFPGSGRSPGRGDRPFVAPFMPDFSETRPQIPISEICTNRGHLSRAIEESAPRSLYHSRLRFAARRRSRSRAVVEKGEQVELAGGDRLGLGAANLMRPIAA